MAKALKLLLIEDSQQDAELILRQLKRAGFDVTHERVDTQAALQAALERSWDIAISDFCMPQFDGLKAFETVRRRNADLPFIFVSGLIGEEQAVEAMRAGAKDYVLKNKLERLGAVVSRELQDATKLKEAKEELENVFNMSADAVCVGDLESGTFRKINPAFAELLGASEAEIVGRRYEDFVHEDDREAVSSATGQLAKSDKVIDFEVRFRTKRGELRWLSWRAVARYKTFYATARDITGQKEQAEALARSNKELEQFAYVASHDLQEPLRMVLNFTALLEQQYGDRLDDQARKYIYFASDGAKRMLALVSDLLTMSRVSTKGKALVSVSLQGVVDEVLAMLVRSKTLDGTRVTCEPLPRVLGDRSQLVQVFQNLIGNAAKFNNKRNKAIRIGAQRRGALIELSVEDNGIGIEERHRERIFEMFQRLHKRSEFPGTGMGLAIVKKIIHRHGGEIWVESTPDDGSAFRFTLRAASAPD